MSEFIHHRLDIGPLHISLVRNAPIARHLGYRVGLKHWHVPGMHAWTFNARTWFVNVDWLS